MSVSANAPMVVHSLANLLEYLQLACSYALLTNVISAAVVVVAVVVAVGQPKIVSSADTEAVELSQMSHFPCHIYATVYLVEQCCSELLKLILSLAVNS